MRATAVRRTALAASAAALTLLATACGGASDADGKDGKKDDKAAAAGSSSAPETPAKTLSADELEKAALAQGDVEGTKITKAGAADEVPADGVKVDKKECLPVAHAMYGVAQEGSAASAKRKVIDEPKTDGKKKSLEDLAEGGAEDAFKDAFNLTSTFVALHSYEGDGGRRHVLGAEEGGGGLRGRLHRHGRRYADQDRFGRRGEGHRRRRVRGVDRHLRGRRRQGPVQAGGAAQGEFGRDVLRLQPGGGKRRRCEVRGADGGRGGPGQEARLTAPRRNARPWPTGWGQGRAASAGCGYLSR